MVSRQAESGSYGKWQESILATFKGSRDWLKQEAMGSGKNRFLPLSNYWEWQESILATFKGSRDWLKQEAMGSGKNRFLPLSKGLETG